MSDPALSAVGPQPSSEIGRRESLQTGIAGVGWITPLGADLETVFHEISHGATPPSQRVANPETCREHCYRPVPPVLVAQLGRHPRLRRSSAISYFAIAAAQAALEDACLTLTPEVGARIAVVFAVSNGGVVYTRRFYEQIVKEGAQNASPLLFPETVYNAPASHLAAFFQIDGSSYTLVGDNSVGLAALYFGAQLLALGDVDRCLVVGCEELDWILCEAYRDWRLGRTPLAEGAGAVLLAREGRHRLTIHRGVPFFQQRDAGRALARAISEIPGGSSADRIVASANHSFADPLEKAACDEHLPDVPVTRPKLSLGEAPGASALWQVIVAAVALRQGKATQVLAPVIGFNQQSSAAFVS